jgi:CRP/FNR family transcriptional regulator
VRHAVRSGPAGAWQARGSGLGLRSLPPLDARELACIAAIIRQPTLMHEGEHLARIDDRLLDLHIIRSGSFKAYTLDADGREHVRNFFMAGQLIALDAIQGGRYLSNLVAMETSVSCRVSYVALMALLPEMPGLTGYILELMSKAMGASEILAGDYSAEERCAAFITGLAEHFGELGWSPSVFNLVMSRRDIANHLRLAPETVTRIFRRFSKARLIVVKGREVTLLDRKRLDVVASCMGPLSM